MVDTWELLAPAGSMDALKAALANGADAVYLGASAFGARFDAGFDEATLRDAIRLAHLHRRKIYITVNILIKDRELGDVRRTLGALSRLGADAVILQDLGLLKICREEFPELPVHASTQMALHNASGARLLKNLGARRVVLARECGPEAIRAAADTGIEVEVFCHGALCVSVSGQCLFSAMLGGRSGNRGRCAQPCRLPYMYAGRKGAWLSLRDLCARDELDLLARAGAYSFKIEGRLKRPEYVAVVTRSYRSALDQMAEGRFHPADAEEKEALTQIFSRGGFTKGYIGHAQDAGVMDESRVRPQGVLLGKTGKCYRKGGALLCDVLLQRPLHNGDGLEIGDQALLYSGPETPAGQIATLRLRDAVKPGEAVRRTEDESQLVAARATYTDEALNRALPIPFDAEVTAFPGKSVSLAVTDGESRAAVSGELCQIAQNKPLDEGAARRALEKTGGTPFALRRLTLKTENAFVSAARLNALRRDALEKLTEMRIAAQPRLLSPAGHFEAPIHPSFSPKLYARTRNMDDIPRLYAAGADEVIFLPRDFRASALEASMKALPRDVILGLPGQCGEETLDVLRSLLAQYPHRLFLASPGQMGAFPGMEILAGEGIPVMNGEAVRMAAFLSCRGVTLSRELKKAEIDDIPADILPLILPVYGRTRLMLLNHCPMRTALGLKEGREQCNLCEHGKGAAGTCLTDRMGANDPLFPIRLPEGCLVELMADKPLHLSGHLDGMERLSWLLDFTDETTEQAAAVTAHYATLRKGENVPPLPFVRGTIGRFESGVL